MVSITLNPLDPKLETLSPPACIDAAWLAAEAGERDIALDAVGLGFRCSAVKGLWSNVQGGFADATNAVEVLQIFLIKIDSPKPLTLDPT